jgi:hypothetical protein
MARLNTLNLNTAPRTHEGTPARHISPEMQLRRSVLACLLWESQFYEDGRDRRSDRRARAESRGRESRRACR